MAPGTVLDSRPTTIRALALPWQVEYLSTDTRGEPAANIPIPHGRHTMVTADHEVPEYQWIAGVNSGHGVLDAIRAAQHSAPAGLGVYSGGALASQWANELASSYAPELNIVGVAAGGPRPVPARRPRNSGVPAGLRRTATGRRPGRSPRSVRGSGAH